jgi:hypothetical protein
MDDLIRLVLRVLPDVQVVEEVPDEVTFVARGPAAESAVRVLLGADGRYDIRHQIDADDGWSTETPRADLAARIVVQLLQHFS